MKIDWFTVIAQMVNFIVLVGLLWHFLYKPILKAIDEREKKIAAQLADAEAKKTEATKEQEDFKQKNEKFDQEKKDLMAKAEAAAETEHQKLLEQARTDATALKTKLDEAQKEAQDTLNHEIMQKTRNEVFAITRKALADLASVSLEEQSGNMFIKRLNELSEDEKKKFRDAFQCNKNPVLMRSAFDLPAKQQAEIKDAVNKILGADTPFQYKTSPELISGIELTANGYKLAWSISEYINSLEKSLPENENDKPVAAPKKK
jgi:F-type H+-transporting ATPase subunit b